MPQISNPLKVKESDSKENCYMVLWLMNMLIHHSSIRKKISFFSLLVSLLLFKTGSHYVTVAELELTMQTNQSGSLRPSWGCLPNSGIKNLCNHTSQEVYFWYGSIMICI